MEREKKKKRGFLGNSTRHLWKTRSLNSELSSIKRETGVAVNAGAKGERLRKGDRNRGEGTDTKQIRWKETIQRTKNSNTAKSTRRLRAS